MNVAATGQFALAGAGSLVGALRMLRPVPCAALPA